ncbi:hypothetical protein RBG61_03870 [Paludicola sp. MB14-C6]|uniref:hypothetical protein n=1 Tax=Paludihabitans sp. MB14-C6 TaxID=3070656 RepID=UPI0027DD0AF0|nr:hypothetical protein [Paludicola sp. MB14-C6]WMJ23813.1 hypothetical protein RBG61_03870 [Paludicola sp. MB14-C6]
MKKLSLLITSLIMITLLTACVEAPSVENSSSEESTATSSVTSTNSSNVASITSSQSSVSSTCSSKTSSHSASSKSASSKSSSTTQSSSEKASSEAVSSEITIPTGEPLPPVSKELQQKYLKGLEAYKWVYSGAMYSDSNPIDAFGNKVPKFLPKGEHFYNYLLEFFDNGYIEERLLSGFYFDESGKIPPTIQKSMKRSQDYISHSFEKVSESQDKIELNVIVTFNENGTKYQASYPLIFECMEGSWMITDFYLWCPPEHIKDNYAPIS